MKLTIITVTRAARRNDYDGAIEVWALDENGGLWRSVSIEGQISPQNARALAIETGGPRPFYGPWVMAQLPPLEVTLSTGDA